MIARLLLVLALGTTNAFAHGLIDEQIDKLTRLIGRSPTNAALYLKRGELRRMHRDWTAALADLDDAIRLDPNAIEVEFTRARVAFDRGQFVDAEAALDRYLALRPASDVGLAARAEVRDRLGRFGAAAADYAVAVRASSEPRLEYYLGQAEALSRAGDDDAALAAADAGIARLGRLAVLEQWSVESLARRRRWDEALARLDKLVLDSPRKETGLTRRAEILAEAGRASQARAAFEAARSAWDLLPERLRFTQAMAALRGRIDAGLNGAAIPLAKR